MVTRSIFPLSRQRQAGLTLIELAVTLVIFAILVAMGTTLGMTWVDNSKVLQSQSVLQNGYSVARAAALQNASGSTFNTPSAYFCVNSTGQLSAVLGTSCTTTTQVLWQGTLSPGVAFSANNQTPSPILCYAFNNMGIPISSGNCITTSAYSLSKGLASANPNFY